MVVNVGHRGAMGYKPENTIVSFKKALELNIDSIELDVHLCGSGELVVIHDDSVDRTTNGEGRVSEKTLEELKKLDAGNGEKIPLLQEVFDLVNKKSIINIELKGEGTAGPVCKLIEEYIEDYDWEYENFFISSFNHNELRKFRLFNQKIKIGILVKKFTSGLEKLAKEINAYSINVSFKVVNKELIKKFHNLGLKVYVWTVNDLKTIDKMKNLGVDGIISDFPDRVSDF